MSAALRRRISELEAKLAPPTVATLPPYLDAAFRAYLSAKGMAVGEQDILLGKLCAGLPLLPSPMAFRFLTAAELRSVEDCLAGVET